MKSYYFIGGLEDLKLKSTDREPFKPRYWGEGGRCEDGRDSILADTAVFSEEEMEALLGKIERKGLYDGEEAYWALNTRYAAFHFLGHYDSKAAAHSDADDWYEEWYRLFMSESEWEQACKDFAELRK